MPPTTTRRRFGKSDRLRQDLQKAENQLGEHRDREVNLRNTLLTAQKVADQIRENAGKEAEVLLRDAEVRSQAMLREAELRSTTLTSESEARALALVSTTEVEDAGAHHRGGNARGRDDPRRRRAGRRHAARGRRPR